MGYERYIRPEILQNQSKSDCSIKNKKTEKNSSTCGDSNPMPTSYCETSSDIEKEANLELNCDCSVALIVSNQSRWLPIWKETWSQFSKVLPYLLLGIAIGALTYGFMPEELIIKYAGADNPLAIPIAAIIGVPLYIRAETVIPISSALAAKGMSMGAIMALIIGSAGASLTEIILLRAIFKKPMLLAFLFVIFAMAIGAGFLFNLFF